MRDWCFLVVSFVTTEDIVLYVDTCIMGCGWPISSIVFRRIMKSLPVTKNPSVSASKAEAATNVKILKLMCVGPFKRSRVHFKGVIPKKKILQRDCVLPVQSDMMHTYLRVKSWLKQKIWTLHLYLFPINPKMSVHFSHLVRWGFSCFHCAYWEYARIVYPPHII